jgi:hypothetical protein
LLPENKRAVPLGAALFYFMFRALLFFLTLTDLGAKAMKFSFSLMALDIFLSVTYAKGPFVRGNEIPPLWYGGFCNPWRRNLTSPS